MNDGFTWNTGHPDLTRFPVLEQSLPSEDPFKELLFQCSFHKIVAGQCFIDIGSMLEKE